jgi:hypothetical protein
MKVGLGGGIGPFRAGISTRGFGVGIGPLSAGTGWGRSRRRNHVTVGANRVRYLSEPQQVPDGPNVPMANLTGATADLLAPTGPGDLVAQLNAAAKRVWWPWLLLVCFLLVAASDQIWWLALLLGLLSAAVTIWVASIERPRQRVNVTYEVDGPVAEWFQGLTVGWPRLATLGGAWRINSQGALHLTHHRKVSGMASHLITRSRVAFRLPAPRILDTNIDVPSAASGSSALYLLPDRVLVKSGRKWSDVDYQHFSATASSTRFIEDERPPRDSQQVGTTWRYANVKGGPDRRFKNNRQLPIMLYGRLELTSPHGLSWVLDLSQPPMAEWITKMIRVRPATQPT